MLLQARYDRLWLVHRTALALCCTVLSADGIARRMLLRTGLPGHILGIFVRSAQLTTIFASLDHPLLNRVVDLRWRAERAVIAAKDAHTMITFLCVSSFCGCRTEAHGLSQARLQDLYAASSIRHTPTCCTSRPRHCPLASLTVYFRALVSYPQMCTATRNARCWRCHMRSTSCFCVLVCCNALEHTCWLHDAERGQVQHLRPSQKGPQACCHDLQP